MGLLWICPGCVFFQHTKRDSRYVVQDGDNGSRQKRKHTHTHTRKHVYIYSISSYIYVYIYECYIYIYTYIYVHVCLPCALMYAYPYRYTIYPMQSMQSIQIYKPSILLVAATTPLQTVLNFLGVQWKTSFLSQKRFKSKDPTENRSP